MLEKETSINTLTSLIRPFSVIDIVDVYALARESAGMITGRSFAEVKEPNVVKLSTSPNTPSLQRFKGETRQK